MNTRTTRKVAPSCCVADTLQSTTSAGLWGGATRARIGTAASLSGRTARHRRPTIEPSVAPAAEHWELTGTAPAASYHPGPRTGIDHARHAAVSAGAHCVSNCRATKLTLSTFASSKHKLRTTLDASVAQLRYSRHKRHTGGPLAWEGPLARPIPVHRLASAAIAHLMLSGIFNASMRGLNDASASDTLLASLRNRMRKAWTEYEAG